MPAKCAHAKKRANARKKERQLANAKAKNVKPSYDNYDFEKHTSPHYDRTITATMAKTIKEVSRLERAIARILLLRYEADIGRLYSTRLHNIALIVLPKIMYDTIDLTASPGWVAANADSEEIKDFFRGAIALDLRQAGERVATKSVLWSYTAIRHFAMSNNVHICPEKGLQSLLLLQHFDSLKAHLDTLEQLHAPAFVRQTHLQSHEESLDLLAEDLASKVRPSSPSWDDWERKIRVGYARLVDTLWATAKEFDIRGYGLVLREKLTTKWCDCGCSTDHLGGVCERTVREEEDESGVRTGKGREWDGRGSGVFGWMTEDEEDVWELDLDFGGVSEDESAGFEGDMTIGELMDWRYFKAERAKELGNKAFRRGDYELAIRLYTQAYETEPEMPHYQLNIAAAHLKLQNWIAAEKACDAALLQHRSSKGYWRRAKARRMQGRTVEAVKDLRHVLRLQPGNTDALAELLAIMPAAAAGLGALGVATADKTCISPTQAQKTGLKNGDTKKKSDRVHPTKAPTVDDPPWDADSIGGSMSSGSSSSSASTSGSSSVTSTSSKSSSGSSHTKSSSTSTTATPTSGTPRARASPNSRWAPKSEDALPITFHENDYRKLRFTTVPMQVEMPVLGSGSTSAAGSAGASGSSKGKASSTTKTGPSLSDYKTRRGEASAYEVQVETFSYPAWERCKAQKVA